MALFSHQKSHTGNVFTGKTLAADETTPKDDILHQSEFDVANEDYEDDMLFGRSGIERNRADNKASDTSDPMVLGQASHYPRSNRKA